MKRAHQSPQTNKRTQRCHTQTEQERNESFHHHKSLDTKAGNLAERLCEKFALHFLWRNTHKGQRVWRRAVALRGRCGAPVELRTLAAHNKKVCCGPWRPLHRSLSHSRLQQRRRRSDRPTVQSTTASTARCTAKNRRRQQLHEEKEGGREAAAVHTMKGAAALLEGKRNRMNGTKKR